MDKLREGALSTKSEDLWRLYRSVRNALKVKIRNARKIFMENALSSCNPRDVWKIIHRILKPNPKPLRVDLKSLNEHFVTTAQRTTGCHAMEENELFEMIYNLPDDKPNSFKLRQVSTSEIMNIIKTLRSDSSTGADCIPINYIKLVGEYIAIPITNIINKCIRESYFPKAWKIARVSPIPKVNSSTVNNQLRPISILPVLSKVFEKVIALQLVNYVEHHAVLNDKVTGFRKGHSTITTLLGIKDDIICAMKKREISLMVLADYSKAFDTVGLQSIIGKMHKLNFSKSFLIWVLNYMSNREQFVQIDDRTSSKMTVHFGIPQGSILGPLFFNLYVADLQENIDKQVTCLKYADDSTLYKHCKY